MATNTKLYDISVKTGEYTDKNGEVKGRYENIGTVWMGDKGQYMMMKRTFNPAGVPFKDGSDSIFISMFAPREENQQKPQRQSSSKPTKNLSDMDDDVPF